MPGRWQPPGYRKLVAALLAKAGCTKGQKSAWVEARDYRPKLDQVNRWPKTLPDNHEDLLMWAEVLGVRWQDMVTVEEDPRAISALVEAAKPPPPIARRADSRERQRARRRQ